jgi:hypothetical protein
MAPTPQTAEELRKERDKIEKKIAELTKIIKNNESLRGSSQDATNYLERLERELAAEQKKLRTIVRGTARTYNTPIQDVTVDSVEVKDPNEPDKGREVALTKNGIVVQSDPTITLSNGDTWDARSREGFMLGMPSTGDAKDVGAYILKGSEQYLQEIYDIYSKDAAKTIETKRRLIEAGQLDASEPLDGNVSEAFRDAVLKVAEFVSKENYFLNKSGQKRQLMTPEQGIDLLIARGGTDGTGSKVSTSATIPERADIQELLDTTYLNSIGRKATKKEIDEFYRKVRKEAKATPTRVTSSPNKSGGSSTIAEEGFGPAGMREMAGAAAETRPEFLAYQLSTNFYNALYNASRLPVNFQDAPVLGSE